MKFQSLLWAFFRGIGSCLDLFPSGGLPKVKKIKLKTFADDQKAMHEDWNK
jgi:hypothetical protein